MKYEINGHIVEADAELSEAEIDEIAASLGPAQESAPASNPFMDVAAKAGNAALNTVGAGRRENLAAPVAEPIQPTSGNPVQGALQAAGQTLQNPLRVSATFSQPGQIAGQRVEDAIGANHPVLGKVANIATAAALDPQSYATGPLAEGVGMAADKAAGMAGQKVLGPAGELASAVKYRDIKRLFENPMEVLTANAKKSGEKMGELEKQVFNVTEDETRLIAKAGDRTPGTARTVVEGLIEIGKQRAQSAGKEASKWAENLTSGELIAARRAASKLSTKAQGRDSFINVKDLRTIEDAFVAKGKEKALEYLSAVRENSMAQTRNAFLQIFPRNQDRSSNALRGGLSLASGITAGPMAALGAAVTQAPLTTGLATLAAKGAYKTAQVVGKPVVKAAIPTGLSAIRSFLNQR